MSYDSRHYLLMIAYGILGEMIKIGCNNHIVGSCSKQMCKRNITDARLFAFHLVFQIIISIARVAFKTSIIILAVKCCHVSFVNAKAFFPFFMLIRIAFGKLFFPNINKLLPGFNSG